MHMFSRLVILQCPTLQYMRNEYEITRVTIQIILDFEIDGDIEKYKTYLDKIWSRSVRKGIITYIQFGKSV